MVKMPSSKVAIDVWNTIFDSDDYSAFFADLVDSSGYTILDKSIGYEFIEKITEKNISDLIAQAR